MFDTAQIGDVVWVPSASTTEARRPCRVCAGTKTVLLVLGSGEQVQLDCGMCGRGMESPTGIETDWKFGPTAQSYIVSAIERLATPAGQNVIYRSGDANWWRNLVAEKCYASREEALAAATAEVQVHEAEAELRLGQKERDSRKSYAWNAGYHLREAKRARQQVEYHETKARLLKAKAKEIE